MNITDDGYSTIDPYDHMFENCPTLAPKYEKPTGCWKKGFLIKALYI